MREPRFTLSLNTVLRFDGGCGRPESNAAAALRRDMEKTLAPSAVPGGRICAAPPEPSLPPESWIIEAGPEELLIRSGDSLGRVYALLFISARFLGVTPFWFWNDQRFTRRPFFTVPLEVWCSPKYAVRFRGWFVNDEVLLDNAPAPEQRGGEDLWAMVFEALLRCGGNMTIPGTDTNSRKYRAVAADMGLRITHHHAEPLGARMFSRAFPGEAPSYAQSPGLFEQLWEEAVTDQTAYQVIWALGFRGQGDRPFWADDPACASEEERGALISAVIGRQYAILKRRIDNPVCCVHLYGEIAGLYREGFLKLPPGVIKVWADNGYGRMVSRRQGSVNPRTPSLPGADDRGPHGVYFHCSYHNLQAANHLTMSPNPAELLAGELEKALAAGAGDFWIINCGSLKPHTHTLDLTGELWRRGAVDTGLWRRRYAGTYYGAGQAEAAAALFAEYARCTARYGPHEDECAGEQIWHHPVRALLCRWMSGDTERCARELIWLTGELPFAAQVRRLQSISQESLPRWEIFCGKCAALEPLLEADRRRFFADTLLLHGRLHRSGASGAEAFCKSFLAAADGDAVSAFLYAERARSCCEEGVRALETAEHGRWAGYYQGDCLTDVRLTLFCLESLAGYLRVKGDGPSFHRWERNFLMPPEERNVMHLSSKQRAFSNEALADALEPVQIVER
jgi:hypothetical protein